jgi:hypothetical protein
MVMEVLIFMPITRLLFDIYGEIKEENGENINE